MECGFNIIWKILKQERRHSITTDFNSCTLSRFHSRLTSFSPQWHHLCKHGAKAAPEPWHGRPSTASQHQSYTGQALCTQLDCSLWTEGHGWERRVVPGALPCGGRAVPGCCWTSGLVCAHVPPWNHRHWEMPVFILLANYWRWRFHLGAGLLWPQCVKSRRGGCGLCVVHVLSPGGGFVWNSGRKLGGFTSTVGPQAHLHAVQSLEAEVRFVFRLQPCPCFPKWRVARIFSGSMESAGKKEGGPITPAVPSCCQDLLRDRANGRLCEVDQRPGQQVGPKCDCRVTKPWDLDMHICFYLRRTVVM